MNHIIPVSFYSDTLALIEHNGQPFVAMKPMVENMGLAWQRQHAKLSERFGSVITQMVTTGADGKQYDMTCLPLRKIPAWLYSINPNKVKPELRDKIIQYQEECDEVLWQYWTKGYAGQAGQKPPTYNQQIAASKERSRLIDKLKKENQKETRQAIYQQIEHASRIMGIEAPEMEKIRPAPKRPPNWDDLPEIEEPVDNPNPLPQELWGLECEDND